MVQERVDAECLPTLFGSNESYNIYKADNTERCGLADGGEDAKFGEHGHGCAVVRWFGAAMDCDA